MRGLPASPSALVNEVNKAVKIMQTAFYRLWHNTAVPLFLERFVLPMLVVGCAALLMTNPMKFDVTQRLTLGAALFFLAYFTAHTAWKSREPKPIADRTDFAIAIRGANIFVPDMDRQSTGIVLSVELKNAGAPSTAAGWQLRVVTPQGSQSAIPLRITDELKLKFRTGGANRILPANDLRQRVGNQPIIQGGVVEGELWFLLKGVNKANVVNPATVLELSACDKDGRNHSTTTSVGTLAAQGKRE